MFKEPAYWMYYFWSKNKRARKDKAVISNATWTMAILWFLNLMALHLLFEAWGWDMLTGWFSSLTDKVEWSRFNPVAYLFAAAMLAPFIWIAGKLYYRPAKLKAMQAKYETMGEYRKLLGQCLFWLYVIEIVADAQKDAARVHDKMIADAQKELTELAMEATKKLVYKDGDPYDAFLDQAERGEPNA